MNQYTADDILRLQEQIDVLQEKCEALKEGYQELRVSNEQAHIALRAFNKRLEAIEK